MRSHHPAEVDLNAATALTAAANRTDWAALLAQRVVEL